MKNIHLLTISEKGRQDVFRQACKESKVKILGEDPHEEDSDFVTFRVQLQTSMDLFHLGSRFGWLVKEYYNEILS